MAVSDYAPDSATVIASASINTSDSVKHKVDLAPENTAFAKQKAFKPPSPSAPPAPRINGRVLAVVLVVLALLAAIFGFVLIGHH
jgi:hypothetical protein